MSRAPVLDIDIARVVEVVPNAPSTPSYPPPFVTLSAKEMAIFQLLSRVRREEGLEDLTLRVAGGWVRDKLLRRQMNNVDIDIALDTLLGVEFAEIVNKWLAKEKMEVHSVGVIGKNPDQSKHLETATMRVLDTWLDLVNLRTETYSHDSRIPDMAIGTPLEDAMRRDLTINALFYNINTGVVEDLTGRGLNDLRAGIVRTPLPPLTTLLDDPLRALRAIRFASRLNFSFDHALFDACKHPQVHEALGAKVSRERVASELDGIMKSDRPTHAIGLLVELGLYKIVFRMPSDDQCYSGAKRPSENLPSESLGALLNLEAVWNASGDGTAEYSPAIRRLTTPPVDSRIAVYAVALIPMAGIDAVQGKKKKTAPLVQFVCGEELRMSSKDIAEIVGVHEAAARFRRLVNAPPETTEDRLHIGLAVRHAGPRWRTALQVALIDEMAAAAPAEVGSFKRGVDKKRRALPEECTGLVEKYAKFMSTIEEHKLDGVWNTKPNVNGNEVFKILPKLKKGKIVGEIMKKQIEYQIQNPNAGMGETRMWLAENYKDML